MHCNQASIWLGTSGLLNVMRKIFNSCWRASRPLRQLEPQISREGLELKIQQKFSFFEDKEVISQSVHTRALKHEF
jgi:hypothetical protein